MNVSTTIARPVSRVFNPFTLSLLALLIAACAGISDLKDLQLWIPILLWFCVVVPLLYVYGRTTMENSSNQRLPKLMSFFREHRREVWVIGIIAVPPCIAILIFLKAPSILLATLIALLARNLAVALVNRFFKASYHLTAVTILTTVAVIVWGVVALPFLICIPLVGWAKFAVGDHSPGQLSVGFIIASIMVAASLYYFGLLL